MSVTFFRFGDPQVVLSRSSTSCLSETLSAGQSLLVAQVHCRDDTHNKDVLFKGMAVPAPHTFFANGPEHASLLDGLRRRLRIARQATNTTESSSVACQPWWRWVREESVPTAAAPVFCASPFFIGAARTISSFRQRPARSSWWLHRHGTTKKGDVSIERGTRQLGLEKSKWCNPYRVRDHGREQALRPFREHPGLGGVSY